MYLKVYVIFARKPITVNVKDCVRFAKMVRKETSHDKVVNANRGIHTKVRETTIIKRLVVHPVSKVGSNYRLVCSKVVKNVNRVHFRKGEALNVLNVLQEAYLLRQHLSVRYVRPEHTRQPMSRNVCHALHPITSKTLVGLQKAPRTVSYASFRFVHTKTHVFVVKMKSD
jgi:hypothetical protein